MKKTSLNLTEELASKLELLGITWAEEELLTITIWKYKITMSRLLSTPQGKD